MLEKQHLLLITHTPSVNTTTLSRAVEKGANAESDQLFPVLRLSPFDTQPEHVIQAKAIILGTTENFGYMSGALKDFFDRW